MAAFFIRRPIVAMVISIIITLAGLVAMSRLPIAQLPEIVPPQIQVTTTYTGADAVTIEQAVATPIEQQVNGVDNMLYMKSTNANDGTWALSVDFEVGTNVDIDNVLVQNRVAQAKNISDLKITTVELSKPALDLAQKNARLHLVQNKIEFIHADMGSFLKNRFKDQEKFDMMISNPPYVPSHEIGRLSQEVRHEPLLALDGGEDGLNYYRQIVPAAFHFLHSDGTLLMEIGDGQKNALHIMFADHAQYQEIYFHKDYTGTPRIVSARRI